MAHITSDGFLNLARVQARVGYVLDRLPEPQPVFRLIQKLGGIADAEMFNVFNMGTGFCLVLPEAEVSRALAMLQERGVEAYRLGQAVADPERKVHLPSKRLVGEGSGFHPHP
jgi:phosphoribosylformylglycinamidine cyclo-ligase